MRQAPRKGPGRSSKDPDRRRHVWLPVGRAGGASDFTVLLTREGNSPGLVRPALAVSPSPAGSGRGSLAWESSGPAFARVSVVSRAPPAPPVRPPVGPA